MKGFSLYLSFIMAILCCHDLRCDEPIRFSYSLYFLPTPSAVDPVNGFNAPGVVVSDINGLRETVLDWDQLSTRNSYYGPMPMDIRFSTSNADADDGEERGFHPIQVGGLLNGHEYIITLLPIGQNRFAAYPISVNEDAGSRDNFGSSENFVE